MIDHQELAARQLATEDFGDDTHWRVYLSTLACAIRALHLAFRDLLRAIDLR